MSEIKPLLREVLHMPDAESVRRTLEESIVDPELLRYMNVAPGLG